MYTVAALYKFSSIEDPSNLQIFIRKKLKQLKIYGTILVGSEGINGTISGEAINIVNAVNFLKTIKGFSELDIKYSESDENPFVRLKIKLKKEIVTIGDDSVDPNKIVGNYVEPENWNELISDPDVIVIDTRNAYETKIGKFKNAIDPKTNSFREFPDWVKKFKNSEDNTNKKIAMFCTGGIRCEKASSLMKEEGFEDVYHLQGGILKYLETVVKENSLWNGECFVFDQRVCLTDELEVGSYKMCFACRMPITEEEMQNEKYIEGISCIYCYDKTTKEKKERFGSRQRQILLAKERGEKHLGGKQTK